MKCIKDKKLFSFCPLTSKYIVWFLLYILLKVIPILKFLYKLHKSQNFFALISCMVNRFFYILNWVAASGYKNLTFKIC